MKLKEKFNTYLHIDEKLQEKTSELSQVEKNIESKQLELNNITIELETKQKELEALKTEIVELKNFISSNFLNKFKNYDYKVDITNCYIIQLNGKKYIAKKDIKFNVYDLKDGFYYHQTTDSYYDVLTVNKNSQPQFICKYIHGYVSGTYSQSKKFGGTKPESEQHIIEAYPELTIYSDNQVPNTHLKKIYYEANDLGSKKLIKSPLSIVPKQPK